MRISIRKTNRLYLERLSAQMESDPTETINYLLTELRRVGYSFNSGVTLAVGSLEPTRPSENHGLGSAVESEVNQKTLGSTGSLMAALTKDPVIEHLLTAGLEQF